MLIKLPAILSLVINNLLAASAYTFFGILSKSILAYDGPASSFWPAAGLANGICFVWGSSYLPSVFLGSFFSFSYSSPDGFAFSPTLGLPIALATTLQVALLLWLTRKLDYHIIPPRNQWSLCRLVLLFGPFGNWISALAFAIVSLLAFGKLSIFPALSWWLGDSTGSLSTSFLVIAIASRRSCTRWTFLYPNCLHYLVAIFSLPLLSSILGNSIIASSFPAGFDHRVLIGYQYKLLLGINELLFVMVAVGFSIDSSLRFYEQGVSLERNRLAAKAAAAVVHEVSQPLMGLDLLLSKFETTLVKSRSLGLGPPLPKITQYVSDCIQRVDHLKKISKSINELISSGIADSSISSAIVALDHAIIMCRQLLYIHDCSLSVNAHTTNPVVACGQIQLQAALRNVIANAILAAGLEGVVRVTIRKLDSKLELIVEDSGPGFGIPFDEVGNNFVSSSKGGMGIGLIIVRLAIEGSGGNLRFGSSSTLGGASVVISLPLVQS